MVHHLYQRDMAGGGRGSKEILGSRGGVGGHGKYKVITVMFS